MKVPDTVRLTLAFADYFESRGIPANCLHVEALRELLILQLAEIPVGESCRRALLITFRQNERLSQQLTGELSAHPQVREHLEELEALLACERAHRGKRRVSEHASGQAA